MKKKTKPSEWVWGTCTVLGKQAAKDKSMSVNYGHTMRVMQDSVSGDMSSKHLKAKQTAKYHTAPLNPEALSLSDTPFVNTDFLAALHIVGRPRPSSEDEPDAIIQRVEYCSELYTFCLDYFGEAGSGVYTNFVTDYDKWWEVQTRELSDE